MATASKPAAVQGLVLKFTASEPELLETEFWHPTYAPKRIRGARGKEVGANLADFAFQWSPAVKVLVAYLLHCAAWGGHRHSDCEADDEYPILRGGQGTPAFSLNAVIAKSKWIQDMFGHHQGSLGIYSLLRRSNIDGKMKHVPVTLRLDEKVLHPCRILVKVDERDVDDSDELEELAQKIEQSMKPPDTSLSVITLAGSLKQDWTLEKEQQLRRKLAELGCHNVRIVWTKEGSIKVALALPPDEAERLFWAYNSGELDDLGVLAFEFVHAPVTETEDVHLNGRAGEARGSGGAAVARQALGAEAGESPAFLAGGGGVATLAGADVFGREGNWAEEIGREHIQKIRELAERLYGTRELSFRIAASIVVRGEAELFGLSVPRFACRVYLGGEGSGRRYGFVNARRLVVLRRAVGELVHGAGGHIPVEIARLAAEIDDPATSCIADSLLGPPPAMVAEGYHILTTELGLAYGEHGQLHGTPYMSHLEIFGGGMCAQAAASQATALWNHCAKALYSVSEITLLGDDHDPEWIDLGGMTPDKLTRYFRSPRVGLMAQHQYVDTLVSGEEQTRQFGDALFAYVSSGVPVILPVDIGRMNGTSLGGVGVDGVSVFDRNRLARVHREGWSVTRAHPHTILVVGVNTVTDEREFLVNDPATFPFLKASARQLAAARRYATAGSRLKLGPLSFIPVLPAEVMLPLHNVRDYPPVRLGLAHIAEVALEHTDLGRLLIGGPVEDLGRFRLFDFAQSQPNQERFTSHSAGFPHAVVSYLRDLVVRGVLPKKWCWAQYTRHRGTDRESVWIWDATLEPPTSTDRIDPDEFLLAVCVRDLGAWSVAWSRPQPGICAFPQACPVPEPKAQKLRGALRPALISTFAAASGMDRVASDWRYPDVGCELYLWKMSDLQNLFGEEVAEGRVSVVDWMAQHADNLPAVRAVADRVLETGLPLVALGPFIAQLTTRPEGPQGARMQRSIRFLARLALAVAGRQRHRGPDQLRVIELVAGSRVDRIYRAEPLAGGGRVDYIAKKMSDEEARRRIESNLLEALPQRLAEQLASERIALALQLEPGPMFALRDWSTLHNLALMVDASSRLGPIVGFNLDIVQWRIAGGDQLISQLRKDDAVRRRVVHAHIAGHHPRAHLSDIHLADLNEPHRDFLPWLRLLEDITADTARHGGPMFSTYVSHEFEAAPDPNHVWDSVSCLRDLLQS